VRRVESSGRGSRCLTQHATGGWEFCRTDQVQIKVKPGCLGALVGQKAAYLHFDEVIFRRESP